MAEIRLKNLHKAFGTKGTEVVAVRDLTITFPSSTVTCLLGPSGCGKTTLMRMIAGLEAPSSGDIYFDDLRVTDLAPSQRKIGMVFQYPVVYRGINVFDNIELPLRHVKGLSKRERKQRVEEVIAGLDLQSSAKKRVDQLDNGTLQKVSVARAVARQPKIILLDEPVTNVDVEAKVQLKTALKNLTKQFNQTIVYVTHDQTEAMTLADEIALMKDGEIVQRGTPDDVYEHPSHRFGGWFLGNPGMNFIPHKVHNGHLKAPLFGRDVKVSGLDGASEFLVGIRPERIRVLGESAPGAVKARIERQAVVIGGQHLLTLSIGEYRFKAKAPPERGAEPGTDAWIEVSPAFVTLFDNDGRRLEASLS